VKKVCVFCGSSNGLHPKYIEEIKKFGHELVFKNYGLVYGGGSVGLMGGLANAVLSKKGEVIGVIPKFLADWEVGHKGLTQLELTNSMHERKERMYELSDLFVVFPGGLGTLDEFFEILTWSQLELHKKPIYLYNFDGFFDHLIAHADRCDGSARP